MPISQPKNVLSRKNGHFKMALNMGTYSVKSIRFIQCIVLANQKGRYAIHIAMLNTS